MLAYSASTYFTYHKSLRSKSQFVSRPARLNVQAMAGNKEQATQLIKQIIADNKVAVFSKTFCPYCKKAKSALSTVLPADKYFVLELDDRDDMSDIQDALLDITGGRSVPRVFVDGEFLGGGDDTARMASDGSLKTLLTTKGVLAA